ncbi:DJ-1/PfpI family protein [Streptomyces sp. NPDC006012]|uniref:DJ-1/PfpI family protein n=1 Tax=Streptomyces sp. NPDC006012 TaxID=3364739 RepID=UPI0036B9206C
MCAGAFVLAAAGLLDGRRAATHWELAAELTAAFPRVVVEADPLFACDAGVVTSAGVSAGVDLALSLVEADYGAGPARDVVRHLVVFTARRPVTVQRTHGRRPRGQHRGAPGDGHGGGGPGRRPRPARPGRPGRSARERPRSRHTWRRAPLRSPAPRNVPRRPGRCGVRRPARTSGARSASRPAPPHGARRPPPSAHSIRRRRPSQVWATTTTARNAPLTTC